MRSPDGLVLAHPDHSSQPEIHLLAGCLLPGYMTGSREHGGQKAESRERKASREQTIAGIISRLTWSVPPGTSGEPPATEPSCL